MKLGDRSREEIESQERCARGDAWKLAKNILKLKETDKATFFSPTNEWSLPAPSAKKPEEREFVVDFGASMHMLSRKDLNSAELEAVKVSENSTTVVTATGEEPTKGEATVYVKELDLFVAVMLLEDTWAVLSLWKTLRRSRIFLPLDQWSETTTHQRWQKDRMQHGELRTDRCPRSIDRLFKLSYTYISDTFTAGHSIPHQQEVRDERHRKSSVRPVAWTSRNQKSKKHEDNQRDPPEWLQKFTENLLDVSVPEHRDAPASSSREPPQEPRGKVVSGKHSIYSHRPKDRNCDICLRNQITRTPCRKRTGTVVPRADFLLMCGDARTWCGYLFVDDS